MKKILFIYFIALLKADIMPETMNLIIENTKENLKTNLSRELKLKNNSQNTENKIKIKKSEKETKNQYNYENLSAISEKSQEKPELPKNIKLKKNPEKIERKLKIEEQYLKLLKTAQAQYKKLETQIFSPSQKKLDLQKIKQKQKKSKKHKKKQKKTEKRQQKQKKTERSLNSDEILSSAKSSIGISEALYKMRETRVDKFITEQLEIFENWHEAISKKILDEIATRSKKWLKSDESNRQNNEKFYQLLLIEEIEKRKLLGIVMELTFFFKDHLLAMSDKILNSLNLTMSLKMMNLRLVGEDETRARVFGGMRKESEREEFRRMDREFMSGFEENERSASLFEE